MPRRIGAGPWELAHGPAHGPTQRLAHGPANKPTHKPGHGLAHEPANRRFKHSWHFVS